MVTTFLAAGDAHGVPASTLTDNGRVYTARFGGGRNAFEYLLALLGIRQKNGSPGHPQTQGKIERFHQTLKRWLARQPAARTWPSCRPSSTLPRRTTTSTDRTERSTAHTPATPTAATPKALPTRPHPGHYRLRYDNVDSNGKISLRRAGRMHHLGIGATHRGKRVLAIADDTTVTIVHLDTGEVLATHTIDPNRSYWRNQQQEPGRWPGSHHEMSHMSRLRCRTCRDSSHGGAEGTRTPDLFDANEARYQLRHSPMTA